MTSAIRTTVAIVLAACWASACSDGDSGGGGTTGGSEVPATDVQIGTFCEAQCDRSARCGSVPIGGDAGATDPQCSSDCESDLGPLADTVRGDIIVAFAECVDRLTCDENDDVCMERALEAVGVDPTTAIESPDVQRCIEKEAACDGTSGDFNDDLCGTLTMLIDSQRQAAASCFERPCEELPDCLGPIVGAL